MLEKAIETKIKKLYKDNRKCNSSLLRCNINIEEAEGDYLVAGGLIEFVGDDITNIRNYDLEALSEIVSLLGKYNKKKDISLLYDKLNVIIIVLRGIYDKKLPIKLTQEQEELLNTFLADVGALLSKCEELINKETVKKIDAQNGLKENDDLIILLEVLLDKVRDPDNLDLITEDEFNLIYSSVVEGKGSSYEEKRDVLLGVKKYNTDLLMGKTKTMSLVSVEEVKSLFEKYGFKRCFNAIDKNKTEVCSKTNLENMEEVLLCLNEIDKEEKFSSRFSSSSILVLCLYGNAECIRNRYEELSKKGELHDIFFDTPSVWIDNVSKSRRARNGHGGNDSKTVNPTSLSYTAHSISYEEILENIKFLNSIGIVCSLEDMNDCVKAIKTPNYRLVDNYEIYDEYGFFEGRDPSELGSTAYALSSVREKCDRFIELGLLNGEYDKNAPSECASYVKNYPNIITSLNNSLYPLLYKLKKDNNLLDYYDYIFSSRRVGTLSGEFTKNKLGFKLDTEEEVSKFVKDNFVDYEDEIPNKILYDGVANIDAVPSEDIMSLPDIVFLENNFRVGSNPYVYMFGNQAISRPKVLRIYGNLFAHGYNLDDTLMYAICYGTYMDEVTFAKVAQMVGFNRSEGVKYGLS